MKTIIWMCCAKNAGQCTWSSKCWVALSLIALIAFAAVELCCPKLWNAASANMLIALWFIIRHGNFFKMFFSFVLFVFSSFFFLSSYVFFFLVCVQCSLNQIFEILSILFYLLYSVSAKQLMPVRSVHSGCLLRVLQCIFFEWLGKISHNLE